MKKIKKPYKKMLILFVAIYVVYTLITQQKKINAYNKEQEIYTKQIAEEKVNNEKLLQTKENINSTEYIEKIAREKLGMYLPNERVYFDITN